jgi:HSP20 family protein
MTLMRREPRSVDLQALFSRPLLAWPEWLGEQFAALEADEMPIEEFEEEGQHVIRAELPGIDPDRDVEVTVQDGVLRIRAERRREETTEKSNFHRQEIRYGAFLRTIPLPAECGQEDVSADYTDGVLTVRIPMDEEKTAAKKVAITRG